MKRISLLLFLWHGLRFPFVFLFFFPLIDSMIIHNFLSRQFRLVRVNNAFRLSRSSFADTCMRAVTCECAVVAYAYSYTDEEQKCKRGWWWLFAPRIRTAWPRVGANWVLFLFSFILLCGFYSFDRCVFVIARMLSPIHAGFIAVSVINSTSFSEYVKYYIFFKNT